MNIFNMTLATETVKDSVKLAKTLYLLPLSTPLCFCGNILIFELGKIRHGVDGRWKCGVQTCRKSRSLWQNTIFHGSHLPIGQVIRIIYMCGVYVWDQLKQPFIQDVNLKLFVTGSEYFEESAFWLQPSVELKKQVVLIARLKWTKPTFLKENMLWQSIGFAVRLGNWR